MTDSTSVDGRFVAFMRAAQAGDSDAYAQLMREITPRLIR